MTQILTQGSAVLAQGPFTDTGSELVSADAVFPKAALGAYTVADVQLPADFTPQAYGWDGAQLVALARQVPVPRTVSMRQFKRALLLLPGTNPGPTLLDDAEAIVGKAARSVQVDWAQATDCERDWPTLAQLAQQLGKTGSDIDQVFITAEGIGA